MMSEKKYREYFYIPIFYIFISKNKTNTLIQYRNVHMLL